MLTATDNSLTGFKQDIQGVMVKLLQKHQYEKIISTP